MREESRPAPGVPDPTTAYRIFLFINRVEAALFHDLLKRPARTESHQKRGGIHTLFPGSNAESVCLSQAHFGEGKEKGEGRFGSLILIDSINLQTVATTTGLRVEDRSSQIIAA